MPHGQIGQFAGLEGTLDPGEIGATGGVKTGEYLYELKDWTLRAVFRHLGVWRRVLGSARGATHRASAGTSGIPDEVSKSIVTLSAGR